MIDDAQQLDPQAARLVRVLAAGAELALIAGDPNQAVFGFRGGEPAGLLGRRRALGDSDDVASLRSGRGARGQRYRRPVARRQQRPADRRRRGGGRLGRGASGRLGARRGGDDRRRAAPRTPGRRCALVADGGDRPVGAAGRRALAARPGRRRGAGGRAGDHAARCPQQPAARALLTVLAATADSLDGEQALALLTGPIGRVDPVSLRQLRRTLQRANPDRRHRRLRRPAGRGAVRRRAAVGPAVRPRCAGSARCWSAAARSHRAGEDPRYTLWAAWHRSGLQRRWLSASERGGPAGAQATRDLES